MYGRLAANADGPAQGGGAILTNEQIFDKVKKLVVDRLGVEESAVKSDASFTDDLGADSLDIVELVMALEEDFEVEIPDSDAENIKTVDDAVNYIKAKKA